MIVVFNKTDVADPEQVKKWLKDYESFTVNYLTLSMDSIWIGGFEEERNLSGKFKQIFGSVFGWILQWY